MPHVDEHNVLHILGRKILPGEKARINFNTAKLYTNTAVEVPVIIQRAKRKGPTVLITAGIHGDEINGVEIVRQVIANGFNKPRRGTIICLPVINVFGFLNLSRQFPDGRDLNRMFPGTKRGSLASRLAHQFSEEILPLADYCLDFHTGGASRFNAAQIRITANNPQLDKLAAIFNAPFTIYSKTLKNSYRAICEKKNIPILLFEGGKSLDKNRDITRYGLEGVKRILNHLDMLSHKFSIQMLNEYTIFISKTKWMRAKYSGLFHAEIQNGTYVEKGQLIAYITDAYGSLQHKVRASNDGYIINVNQSPVVYQGDAIFHISTEIK
ncbi:MAG: succinylglutamate desuccinylase/aspartoacylase family protein [Psychroflexus sp.]|nr:succinylglutamate desuccinylase/aspartoacylase family protein [Psychroflexus sp.]MDN6309750.1 succinylglutamate desuccinylase/aspartoacylase family protein [Psychroflexus sp.]